MADDKIIHPDFNKSEEESESLDAFRNLTEAIPQMEGIESLGIMLELPEEDFEALKPILLEEMEKGFNNSNDKYNLALALNESNMSVADLERTLNEAILSIDVQFEKYSQSKRDFLKQTLGFMVNAMSNAKALRHRIIRIPTQLCNPDAHLPTYANDGDAGCDVYSICDYTLSPGETCVMPTGLKMAIPAGYELQVRPRSGMSVRTKMRISNSPGTIDSGYRDEIGIIVDNIGTSDITIVKGQRIAQFVLNEIPTGSFYEVDDITQFAGNRGGGYGSTGA